MKIEVLSDVDAVARRAASIIAADARVAVEARGRFVLAVSGGRTPWRMMRLLADEDVPWPDVHLVQVDERAVPAGDPERNLTHISDTLLAHAPVLPDHLHAMPVDACDLGVAAKRYAAALEAIAGAPPSIDLVHLGLGDDGHTASLFPHDPVIEVEDAYVAVTSARPDCRRMTLTFPALALARRILWVVTGAEKADALAKLERGDPSIPASRVRRDVAHVLADPAAASRLEAARHG